MKIAYKTAFFLAFRGLNFYEISFNLKKAKLVDLDTGQKLIFFALFRTRIYVR